MDIKSRYIQYQNTEYRIYFIIVQEIFIKFIDTNVGRFCPDISATDVSAKENAKGGRFGQIINFGLGCMHA